MLALPALKPTPCAMLYRKKIETSKQVRGGKISEADRNSAALFYTERLGLFSLGMDTRRKPGEGLGGAAQTEQRREDYWIKTV